MQLIGCAEIASLSKEDFEPKEAEVRRALKCFVERVYPDRGSLHTAPQYESWLLIFRSRFCAENLFPNYLIRTYIVIYNPICIPELRGLNYKDRCARSQLNASYQGHEKRVRIVRWMEGLHWSHVEGMCVSYTV